MKSLHLCAALLSMAATLSFAQDLRTATLVGTVTDASGATVANADVTVTNVDTQVVTRENQRNRRLLSAVSEYRQLSADH